MKTIRTLSEKDSMYFFDTSINTMEDAIGIAIIDKSDLTVTFDFNAVLLLRFEDIIASELYPLSHPHFVDGFSNLLKEISTEDLNAKSNKEFVRSANDQQYHFMIKIVDHPSKIELILLCQEKLIETEEQIALFGKVMGLGSTLFVGSTWWIDYDHHDGCFYMTDSGIEVLGIPLSDDHVYKTSEFQMVREKASIVSDKYDVAVELEKEAYEKVRRNETDFFSGRSPTVTDSDDIVWVEAYGKCVLRYPDGSPRFFIAIDIYMSEIFEEKTQLQLLTNLIDYGLINSNVGIWYHQRYFKEGLYHFTESYQKLMTNNETYKDETITGILDRQIELMKQDGRGYEEYIYNFRNTHNSIYTDGVDKYKVIIPNYKDENTFNWIEIRGNVIERDEDGYVLLFVGVNVDVTERFLRNQELERLRIQNERLQLAEDIAIKAGNLMMWYYDKKDPSTSYIFGNDEFETSLGLKRDDEGNILISDLLSTLVNDSDFEDRHETIKNLFNNLQKIEYSPIDKIISKHKNLQTENEIFIEHSIKIGTSNTGQQNLIGGVMMDVTKNVVYQEKIRYLAEFDTLTGVHNRNYFESYISTNLPQTYTILIFDLDGLKLINDAFGHLKGDEIIKQVATFLRDVYSDDLFIARIGGDEFAVLLEHANPAIIENKSIYFDDMITLFNDNSKVTMNVSKGSKSVVDENIDFDKAFVEAENIMYRRKLNNRKSRKSRVLESIIETLNAKTEETKEHSERLGQNAVKTFIELGFSRANEIEDLELLARVHDIGKITIEDRILKKPSKLTPSEFEIVKKHCEAGYKIIRNITDSDQVCNGVLFHHEKWDGSGYPQGLKGEEIPLFARILTVVDSYDAMIHDRVYRKKMSHQEAVEELNRCSGTQFDPKIVDAFLMVCEEEHND